MPSQIGNRTASTAAAAAKSEIGNRKSEIRNQKRGSVLILAVAVLVLLVLIGTAYIQAARSDRNIASMQSLAGATAAGPQSPAVQSELARIQQLLKNDLVSPTGDFLDDGGADAWTSREPYDYPHATIDPWLASTAPNPSTLQWTNISNVVAGNPTPWVNGTALNLGVSTSPPTDISTNSRADADGDGITDSQFVDAVIGTINGRRYVVAIRIVDLSAMLNINVATAPSNQLGAYDPTTSAPRWWYPSDLDLARFVFTLTEPLVDAPLVELDLKTLLRTRFDFPANYATNLPTPWSDPIAIVGAPTNNQLHSRSYFWLNGPSLYGNFNGDPGLINSRYRSLNVLDELKLRMRNGLNTPSQIGTNIDLSVDQPGGGYNPTSFGSFIRDVIPVTLGNRPSTMYDTDGDGIVDSEPDFQAAYIYDGTAYQPISAVTPVLQQVNYYFAYEPRHQMTTMSGSSTLAPDKIAADRIQRDLNYDAPNIISGTINSVYSQGTPTLPPNITTVAEFSDQLAAAIADYRDDDSNPTLENGRYGLEALPFITEVYVQHDYRSTNGGATDNMDGTWTVSAWTKRGEGFAIEIRNPFPWDIDISDVAIQFNGGAPISLSGGFTNPTPNTLDAGEYILIFLNTGYNNPSNYDDIRASLGLTPDISMNWNNVIGGPANPFETATDVVVEMVTDDNTGTDVVYQRITVKNVIEDPANFPTDNNYPWPSGPPSQRPWGYKQRSAVGNGNGVNMYLTQDGDFEQDAFTNYDAAGDVNPLNPTGPENYVTVGEDALGDPDKTDDGGPPDKVNPTSDQILLRNDDLGNHPASDTTWWSIWHLGELGQIVMLGCDTGGNTYADNFSGNSLDPFRINFIAPSTEFYGTGNFELPHALILLDNFTTLSPALDMFDNDGDGVADEADEQFIPGRININTVAGSVMGTIDDVALNRHILQRILPIPDATVRDLVITNLIGYRDLLDTTAVGGQNFQMTNNRASGVAGWRDQLGIASIGELFTATRTILTTAPYNIDNNTLTETLISGAPGAAIQTDFTPEDADTNPDGITDDLEEQLMPLSWLGQVLTVRSDRFVVYGLIRGYEDTNNNGNELDDSPVEQLRFIAILDRSGIVDETGQVKILSLITY